MLQYDDSGNVSYRYEQLDADPTWNYRFDAGGRLIRAARYEKAFWLGFGPEDLEGVATYRYDALGRRTMERNQDVDSGVATTTYFHYDGKALWLDAAPSGHVRYVVADDPSLRFARIHTDGRVAWYLHDRNHNTRQIIDNQGRLINFYRDAGTAPRPSHDEMADRWRLAGRESDEFTGLMHQGGRYTDPASGVSITADQGSLMQGDTKPGRNVGNLPTGTEDESFWSRLFSIDGLMGLLDAIHNFVVDVANFAIDVVTTLTPGASAVIGLFDGSLLGDSTPNETAEDRAAASLSGTGRRGTTRDRVRRDMRDAGAGLADSLTFGISSALRGDYSLVDVGSEAYQTGSVAGQVVMTAVTVGGGVGALGSLGRISTLGQVAKAGVGAAHGVVESYIRGDSAGEAALNIGMRGFFGLVDPTASTYSRAVGAAIGGGIGYALGGSNADIARGMAFGDLAGGFVGAFSHGFRNAKGDSRFLGLSSETKVGLKMAAYDVAAAGVGGAVGYVASGGDWDAVLQGANIGQMAGNAALRFGPLQKALLRACFTAETPLLWEGGSKPISEFVAGERVWARDEFDVNGRVELKTIEEVFVREAIILNLHVSGQVIRTTGEHPFYVYDKDWLPAARLQPGDLLSSHDGKWNPVEDVFDTGETETVYNLRVADYHTYFVGCEEWAFSVWAHNAYAQRMTTKSKDVFARKYARNLNKGKDTNWSDLTPKQQRAVREHAVRQGYVNEGVLHNNNLNSPAKARGYSLRDRDTGEILRYGETTKPGTTRYSMKYLKSINADLVFEASGTKREMHSWQHKRILDHTEQFGQRPSLNRNDY